jgi:hypothetical protein
VEYIDVKLKIRAACPHTARDEIKALYKVDGIRKFWGKFGTFFEQTKKLFFKFLGKSKTFVKASLGSGCPVDHRYSLGDF